MLDIAHRGASEDAPENTLEAFELAIEQGADMIETDLHHTRDAEIVLVHDAEVASREVGALTLAELRELAPSIPTLCEVLDRFGERIPFNLELKRGGSGDYPGLPQATLDEVRKRGLLERTLFSSFYDSVLERLRAGEEAARIALLVSRRAPRGIVERAARVRAEAVNPDRAITTPERVDAIHAAGYRVYVFTVDEAGDQLRLRDWGVDGLFTNRPAQLRRLLDQ